MRTGKPVTNDDLERDHVLRQRIQLLSWLRPEHLEIPTVDGSQGFISFAEKGTPWHSIPLDEQ